MKVLHVCYMDGKGGAAIGAYGLHRAMLQEGVNSRMLVAVKTTDDPTVSQARPRFSRIRKSLLKMERRILSLQKTHNPVLHTLSIFPTGLARLINESDVDIVQLHWISMGTISIGEIASISKPIAWKMPDMWAFSGAEHYLLPGEAERYQQGYTRSNRPLASGGVDINKWLWLYKKLKWRGKLFHIVGTSSWIAECARKSVLFQKHPCRVINNPIDLDLFCPTEKEQARRDLGLPVDRLVILFGSWHVEKDRRKGFDKLLEALAALRLRRPHANYLLLVFGANRRPDFGYAGSALTHDQYEERYLGELSQDTKLRDAYNAANVFVTPSLLEGFGLTAAESLACGTPVVCFDTSGLKDIVDHQINGYRARCYDSQDLAVGIDWCLSADAGALSHAARAKAETAFNRRLAVNRYIEMYEEMVGARSRRPLHRNSG
jgi:glycosyltransferase involved in cell wall biosynthesis